MAISFDQPLWWLALPGLVILAWYWRRPWLLQARAGSMEAYRREWRRLLARLLVLLLLVAALAGPRWFTTVNHQAVVFALDASASMGTAVAAGEAWLRQALALKPPRDRAGVIAFGETALVEVPLSEEPLFRRLETAPGTDGSNFGAALNLAQGLLPAEARRRLVLISDGRETGEEAVTLARELSQAGIRVDVYPLGTPAAADLRLDGLELPPRAYAGETSSMQITVIASRAAEATIVLERDNELVASRQVNLLAGSNRLTFPVEVGTAGLHRYRARLLAEQNVDGISANNEAGAVQQVLGPPRVLLVADTAAEAAALQQVLEAGQVEVETVTPAGVPQDPAGWARYSGVFLLDVPAYNLGEKAMDQLESYVRDGGGGLMMSGGPNAFGPGGYAGTPIEKALPVEMQIEGQGELPSLGLMLVIDRSGSMDAYAGGANKIDLAKEAAARAAAMLTARDQVGVIAFDSSPWEVVPLGPVTNQELLRQQIGSIYAGGGTEIYPALAAAYHALAGATTRVKHIILLTDGISASGGPYLELIEALNAEGITLTTVAVGEDADSAMLKALAELGRGRFYATSEADAIPAIFTRETMLATRSYAVNEHFYPRVVSGGPLLAGIEAMPPLDGYITTTPKPLASLELISHRGEPVLSSWQYGLGRSVAWTPDVSGRWSSSWLSSPAFARLAGNILSWLLPAGEQGEVQVRANLREERGERKVIIEVDDAERWQQIVSYQARVLGPDGASRVVALQAAGPGVYRGELSNVETGAYVIYVSRQGLSAEADDARARGNSGQDDSAATGEDGFAALATGGTASYTSDQGADPDSSATTGELVARTGVVVPYPAEYRLAGIEREKLAAIAAAGGGAVLTRPEEAFSPNLAAVRASQEMAWLLLLLAGLLWFIDVAQRRFTWSRAEKAELLQAWRAALLAGEQLALTLFLRDKRTAPKSHSIRRLQKGGFRGRLSRYSSKDSLPGRSAGDVTQAANTESGEREQRQAAVGDQSSSQQTAAYRSEPGRREVHSSEPPAGQKPGIVPPGREQALPRAPGQTMARLLAAKKQRRGN